MMTQKQLLNCFWGLDMKSKVKCEHDVLWVTDEFYGVYPRIEKGVCIKCGKNFHRIKGKGGVDDDKIKADARRTE
jgi:hypothetical protein